MRRCMAVPYCNALLHQRCIRCWGMSNGGWRISQVGWEIKWRTGWNACINGGMRMRWHFWTVQDPLVHALLHEKATSRNMHPNVLAKVESTDLGNKQNLSERKADLILIKQQKQRDEGCGSRHWNILAMPKRRRLPGRQHYSTTGRLICMTWTPRFWNICVILTRGARSESEVHLSEFLLAIRVI